MQIRMHRAICGTEYSCSQGAHRPCSSPNAEFLLPSLSQHADREQQGKEQEGERKVSSWQKFTTDLMMLKTGEKTKYAFVSYL